MSTYTDMRARVKENVAVGSKDRITTQPVRFMNEENEFWGTFSGKVTAVSTVLSGAILTDSRLEGSTVVVSDGQSTALSVVAGLGSGDAVAYVPGFKAALEQASAVLSVGPDDIKYRELVDAVYALYGALTSFNFSGSPRPEPGPEPDPPSPPPPEPDVKFIKVTAAGHEGDQDGEWDYKSFALAGFSIIGEGFAGREDDLVVTVSDGGQTLAGVAVEFVDDATIRCLVPGALVGHTFVVTLGLRCVEEEPVGSANVLVVADPEEEDPEEENPEG